MKVLVIGSGAREHALIHAFYSDPDVVKIVAAPGNPGIAAASDDRVLCLSGVSDTRDSAAVIAAARDHEIDLVVIGPEAPLVSGVADDVREAGFACFGPSAAAARLEGSKAFAKEVMAAADVPTARARLCSTGEQVQGALDATIPPYVVKDDGLAGGKGVVVTEDVDAALAHGLSCLDKPDGAVVIEDFLDGPEVSLFCITDGITVRALQPAQDFKRLRDDDQGPNTGGMGAYSPLPWLDDVAPGLVQHVLDRVATPTIAEMAKRGAPFVGVLYVGLALTEAGPRVVEFNARLGDPETQSVLALLQTPLAPLLMAAATGGLAEFVPLAWHPEASVTVVLAAQGYPEAPQPGAVITGLDEAAQVEGVHVLHAGTAFAHGRAIADDSDAHDADDSTNDGEPSLVVSGGRVLSVVAVGDTLASARSRAYEAISRIRFDGAHYRRDIAADASGPAYVSMQVDGHVPLYAGKVRELYAPLDPQTGLAHNEQMLLVASDRVSAYDFVLSSPVPDKGIVLTQLSLWWLDQLGDLCANHLASTTVPDEVRGRGIYVHRLAMLPVECIARAYLTGGGLAEYRASGTVSGVELPDGLMDGSQLPEPIFTPSTKAPAGEHDEPMTYVEVEALIGPALASAARNLALAILIRGNQIARERGIIVADTKVEFGIDPRECPPEALRKDGTVDWLQIDPHQVRLILADEILTPDSSRFWRASQWQPGRQQTSYDKQVLRDWLTSDDSGWDRSSGEEPPALPPSVVATTRARYVEAFEALTGQEFDPNIA